MYKVFVNDKPLFLTNEIVKETDFQLFLLESADIKQVIVKIFQNKIQKAYLYHPDEKEIMKTLKTKIPVQKAGGGLVYNAKNEVLFIGDTLHDAEVAEAMGVNCILIANGHQVKERLMVNSNLVLNDLADLLNYLQL